MLEVDDLYVIVIEDDIWIDGFVKGVLASKKLEIHTDKVESLTIRCYGTNEISGYLNPILFRNHRGDDVIDSIYRILKKHNINYGLYKCERWCKYEHNEL